MVKIKICGITQTDNMLEIAALLPDYMGFIFFKNSPRDVSDKIDGLPLNGLPAAIKKVAVFVNIPLEDSENIIRKYAFDRVQLHGNESPDYCKSLQKIVPVIKAFGITDKLPDELAAYENCCDYFLFDTLGKNAGGTGTAFDHAILKNYTMSKPFFLAGGIGPEHLKDDAFRKVTTHPSLYALDINSRFETSPGVKDVGLIEKFILGKDGRPKTEDRS
ncbi:MAG: phosphoribosylanthranilate isomerase [Bacteroidetes bacterium]|nr:MAG: phosphoribosylanthranilate isomerase [Bacteroidota bacterium]